MASSRDERRNSIVTSPRITNGSRSGGQRKTSSPSKSSTSGAIRERPIEVILRADTPLGVLRELRNAFGIWIESIPADSDLVELATTSEWRAFHAKQTPGSWLSGLRDAVGWTQRELGVKMGGVSPARISDWEHDRREISKDAAKKLAALLKVPADRFL